MQTDVVITMRATKKNNFKIQNAYIITLYVQMYITVNELKWSIGVADGV